MLLKDVLRLNKITDKNEEIGIEVEAEGRRLPLAPFNNWDVKKDNSLRGEQNAEYVLMHPISREEVRKNLQDLQYTIDWSKGKIIESDRAGVHIHINCQWMTVEQVYLFIFLLYMVEHPLVRYCGPAREGNLFCLRLSDAKGTITHLLEDYHSKSFRAVLNNDYIRYSAINLSCLGKFGTIEIRCLKTPSNVMDVATWVDMLLRVKDCSLLYAQPTEILEAVSAKGGRGFMEGVFGDLAEKLISEETDDDLLNAAREIQAVVYCHQWKDKDMQPFQQAMIDAPPPQPAAGYVLLWLGEIVADDELLLGEERPAYEDDEDDDEDEDEEDENDGEEF